MVPGLWPCSLGIPTVPGWRLLADVGWLRGPELGDPSTGSVPVQELGRAQLSWRSWDAPCSPTLQ